MEEEEGYFDAISIDPQPIEQQFMQVMKERILANGGGVVRLELLFQALANHFGTDFMRDYFLIVLQVCKRLLKLTWDPVTHIHYASLR
jgi:hypothetical protein